ncbi:MAG: hypothetical protein JWO19_2440 [Bryobacterales bacterium]|nr:hypothetical protein [Bryobacterales bacterium]
MMDVLWEGRMLTMLAIDVTAGGKEITGQRPQGLDATVTSKRKTARSGPNAR